MSTGATWHLDPLWYAVPHPILGGHGFTKDPVRVNCQECLEWMHA